MSQTYHIFKRQTYHVGKLHSVLELSLYLFRSEYILIVASYTHTIAAFKCLECFCIYSPGMVNKNLS